MEKKADPGGALAFAPPNFALAKYWGKSDAQLRHPSVPSVSLCVQGLEARAFASFDPSLDEDEVFFAGEAADAKTRGRVVCVLDAVRAEAGVDLRASVRSRSDFAVAAGLASSAAGLAAVAGAAWKAAGLGLERLGDIADIARLGSGSACRSIHGGYVAWEPTAEGSRVRPIAPAEHWPLEISVAMVDSGRKKIGSTEAMAHSAKTSPSWRSWVESSVGDAAGVEQAILDKDFSRLSELAESNCLLMHATTMTARPPILYFKGQTLSLFHKIRGLRDEGYGCFFSVDAGPNVMIFTLPGERAAVLGAIKEEHPGLNIIELSAGSGLRYEENLNQEGISE